MAILPILVTPDPRLRLKAQPVETVDASILKLMRDMLETMYDDDGIGLAANQVGDARRVIVIDVADRGVDNARPYMMANPEIVRVSEETKKTMEGCLSVPGHYAPVIRPTRVVIKYINERNEACELEASELLAACVQHEIDHLDGILFVDHLSPLKRNMILKKVEKEQKRDEI